MALAANSCSTDAFGNTDNSYKRKHRKINARVYRECGSASYKVAQ